MRWNSLMGTKNQARDDFIEGILKETTANIGNDIFIMALHPNNKEYKIPCWDEMVWTSIPPEKKLKSETIEAELT